MLIQKFSRKLQRNIADYGKISALKKASFYPIKPVFDKSNFRIYCIDLDSWKVPEDLENQLSKFTFKLITPSDEDIIHQIEWTEEWLMGKLKDALDERRFCLVALDNNELAGFNLISFKKIYIPLLQKERILNDDEAWSDQITVKEEYRRQGLACNLRYRIFSELKNRKIKKLWGGTLIHNHASLALARRAGFCFVEDVHFTKLFWFKKWRHIEIKDESV